MSHLPLTNKGFVCCATTCQQLSLTHTGTHALDYATQSGIPLITLSIIDARDNPRSTSPSDWCRYCHCKSRKGSELTERWAGLDHKLPRTHSGARRGISTTTLNRTFTALCLKAQKAATCEPAPVCCRFSENQTLCHDTELANCRCRHLPLAFWSATNHDGCRNRLPHPVQQNARTMK